MICWTIQAILVKTINEISSRKPMNTMVFFRDVIEWIVELLSRQLNLVYITQKQLTISFFNI